MQVQSAVYWFSKVANTIRKFLLKDDCNDTACALKIFNRSHYLKIKYFRNMHRFLPALFKMNNCKIFNVQVDDRLRYSGVSKYSFNNRFWVGIIDLIKVYFLFLPGWRLMKGVGGLSEDLKNPSPRPKDKLPARRSHSLAPRTHSCHFCLIMPLQWLYHSFIHFPIFF